MPASLTLLTERLCRMSNSGMHDWLMAELQRRLLQLEIHVGLVAPAPAVAPEAPPAPTPEELQAAMEIVHRAGIKTGS